MTNYRCYFLDSGDHVTATDLIDCENDAQARTRADVLLTTSPHAGIEVWDGPWKVYRADKPRVT
jgi:hypothetical protein